MAYIEVDPRLLKTWESALPLVWDLQSEMGADARTDAFLMDAAGHGVGSGVAFPLHDARYSTNNRRIQLERYDYRRYSPRLDLR